MNSDVNRASGTVERDIEQAITALKKGACLLKYGRRGKPKFCPFRLANLSECEMGVHVDPTITQFDETPHLYVTRIYIIYLRDDIEFSILDVTLAARKHVTAGIGILTMNLISQ